MYNVILPTYNEVDTIIPMIRMLQVVFEELKEDYRIVVVDDHSPDGTWEAVETLNSEHVKLIIRPGKQGLGTAYKTAIEHCIYPYTIILDSDLQHDPFAIIDMCQIKDLKTDIVTGTRYVRGGAVCGWTLFRRFTSCFANNLSKIVLGLRTSDLTGSFRLYRTKCLSNLINEVRSTGFGFQMEIIARAEAKSYKIVECPITFYDRTCGESKLGTKEIFVFLLTLARLYVYL